MAERHHFYPQGNLRVLCFCTHARLCDSTKKASSTWTTPDTGKNGLQRYPQRWEGLAALRPSFKSGLYSLSLHADYCFQHAVHSGDGFRVCLEAALGGDHLNKFPRHVHVGLFDVVGLG